MPSLDTARLTIRPWTLAAADVAAAFAVFGDGEVTRYLTRREPDLASQRRALARLIRRSRGFAPGLGWFALERRADGAVVGCGVLKPLDAPDRQEIEVGYHLARAHWGQGYATESAAALLEQGLGTLGLERVVAVVDPRNARSLAVVARLDMRPAGQLFCYGRTCLCFVRERDKAAPRA